MPERPPAPDAGSRTVQEAARSESLFAPGAARAPETLPRALRPRAKLFARGAGCLSLGELLALLLGGARRREPPERIADRLLRRAGRVRLSLPLQVHRYVRRLGRAKKEHLIGLYLDSQNGLLHRETISIGSLNTTRTHPREILYPAIAHLALGFILVHNHPSGCLEPSPEDMEFTQAVRRAGELMGIELYDHPIVGGDGYTSLRERGLL